MVSPVWARWAVSFVSVAIALSSLELLSLAPEFADGVYAERIVGSRPHTGLLFNGYAIRAGFFKPAVVTVLVAIRLIAAFVLLVSGIAGHISLIALIAAAITSWMIGYRNLLGGDGSDQMSLLIVLALIPVVCFPNDHFIQLLCPWFIALQSVFSYLAAGVAKAVSSQWRSGECVLPILRTTAYGQRKVASILAGSEHFPRLAGWATIIFELSFPTVLFGFRPAVLGLLIAGVMFHAANAVLMGLNCFFWAFLAAYPAILFVTHVSV